MKIVGRAAMVFPIDLAGDDRVRAAADAVHAPVGAAIAGIFAVASARAAGLYMTGATVDAMCGFPGIAGSLVAHDWLAVESNALTLHPDRDFTDQEAQRRAANSFRVAEQRKRQTRTKPVGKGGGTNPEHRVPTFVGTSRSTRVIDSASAVDAKSRNILESDRLSLDDAESIPPPIVTSTMRSSNQSATPELERNSLFGDDSTPNTRRKPNAASLWGNASKGIQFDPATARFVWLNGDAARAADVEVWTEAYPAVDVELALRQAGAWCKSETKRGRKSDYRRFLNEWLRRQQDSGGTRGAAGRRDASVSRREREGQPEIDLSGSVMRFDDEEAA